MEHKGAGVVIAWLVDWVRTGGHVAVAVAVAVAVGVTVGGGVAVAVMVAVGDGVGDGVDAGCTSNEPMSMRPLKTRG